MTSQETTCYAISNIVYYTNVTFQQIIVPYKLPKWFNVWRLIVTLEASEAFLCICSQRTQNSERFGYGIFVAMDSSKVCANHFTADQFKTHPALAKKCGYKKLELRPDAVPTLFDLPSKAEKKQRTSTAYFKRRTIEVRS